MVREPARVEPGEGGEIAAGDVRRLLVLELDHEGDVIAEVLVVVHGGEVRRARREEVAAVAPGHVVELERRDGSICGLLLRDGLDDGLGERSDLNFFRSVASCTSAARARLSLAWGLFIARRGRWEGASSRVEI